MRKYRKALTFSYDDGIEQDRKLVEIFNKYGMKATFNLNTGIQTPESNFEIEGVYINRMKQEGLEELYRGHEIATHGLTHAAPTGMTKEQLDKVRESACKVAVLKSANMSLGINTLFKLLQDAAKVFIPSGYDVEIVERHHNQKLDAPSGTALALADAIKEVAGDEYYYKYDRSQEHKKRDPKEIGISAVRGGTIVGVHDVIFAGEDEVIEFIHTAYSKSVFAKGAIEAAKFLAGKPAGMYDMTDVIASK